jgi:hypothetical protein
MPPELTKIDGRENKFREVRPKGQKQAQAQGSSTHSRNTHKQPSNNHIQHRRYFRYQERLLLAVFGGSSTKTIELILFILGSWLVIDVDAFFLLSLASLNLMVVDEVDAVLLSR